MLIAIRRQPLLRCAPLLALTLLLASAEPAWAKKKSPPEEQELETAGLRGKIYEPDGKRAARGVVVRAVNLSDNQEFRSKPSDGKGRFRLEGLPHGYYDIAFETPDGLYVGNQVINVPPGGFGVVAVRLGVRSDTASTTFPAENSAGYAALERKLNVRQFWKSPKGIAIIAALGGGALLALAVSSGDDEATAFTVNP